MLTVDICAEDVSLATKRCNGKRNHLWHNPIAIALERRFGTGAFAVVTDERVFIATNAITWSYYLTELGKIYLRDWKAGKNDTSMSLFVGTIHR